MMKEVIFIVMVLLLSACEIVEQPPLYKGVVGANAERNSSSTTCQGYRRSQWIKLEDENGRKANVFHCSNYNEGSLINQRVGILIKTKVEGYVIREHNGSLRFVLKDEYDPETMQAISL